MKTNIASKEIRGMAVAVALAFAAWLPGTANGQDLSEPVATVFDNYAHIQTALAQDSVRDVAKEAQAIAKAVTDDAMKAFSTNIAQQAQAVAKAADLRGVREAFKPLSKSLIEYVSKHPALAGSYRQVHCPMANADWLQKESTVNNPYFGKEMPHCGELSRTTTTVARGKAIPCPAWICERGKTGEYGNR